MTAKQLPHLGPLALHGDVARQRLQDLLWNARYHADLSNQYVQEAERLLVRPPKRKRKRRKK